MKDALPILVQSDSTLRPYEGAIRHRRDRYVDRLAEIDGHGGLLGPISQGHDYFGFHRGEWKGRPGVWYREWAPAAHQLYLTGEFNGWDRRSHPLERGAEGVWTLFVPDVDGVNPLAHGSQVKVHILSAVGAMDRIPLYARYVVQDPQSKDFIAQVWLPPSPYRFAHDHPLLERGLRIYEAHVGMATEHYKVGSFTEFAADLVPRVKALGYNAIQLMAIMEHPYYASFGYHISSFFAVSSRFGTPEELKQLIDTAHAAGIVVLMDLVHSHAVKNTQEGLDLFDGTSYQFFHAGGMGDHPQWDSKLFDYAKHQVQHFLLSNIRYWLEEYRFDGLRLDGVTSMLYRDHGIGRVFASYDDYFGGNVDEDALLYLQLANTLVHAVRAEAVTIAEDVSGMPGMARPAIEGGVGFDYRLNMGVPDYWIELVKEKPDEQWPLAGIYHRLLNRRHNEKHVGYVESHDQALVGDQTLLFRMLGAEMYWNMNKAGGSLVIDRGIALVKLVRLLTFSLAGEAYLNFMGNEFGHPEWIDFPREGNNESFHYARRLWSLTDNDALRYGDLQRFDIAMLALDTRFDLLRDPFIGQLALDEGARLLVYRRGPLVFAYNFHPTASYADLRLPVPDPADYEVVLNTDATAFSGHGRSAEGVRYPMQSVPMYGRNQSIQIYLPSRSAQVLAPCR
ncbi:MAG: glgB1 [Chthonomonadaceae bacterium]|nr:glgB1 [Chthonomonadaceae bacterium]